MDCLKEVWFMEKRHVKLGVEVGDFIFYRQNEIILYIIVGKFTYCKDLWTSGEGLCVYEVVRSTIC